MAVTVSGTSITFNDATVQTTAAGGAPTTAQVLAATAGASVGAVGTYAFLIRLTTGSFSEGATTAGSTLRFYGTLPRGTSLFNQISSGGAGGAPAGTWRCMGTSYTQTDPYAGNTGYGATLWLRIS